MSKVVATARSVCYTICELVAGIIFSSFAWPAIFIVYTVNKSLRTTVNLILNYVYGDVYTVANGEDSIFGTRIYNNCGSIIVGYEVFEGEGNLEIIREKFHKLITETNDKYDRLTQSFVSKFGYFCWEKKSQLDLNRHIRIFDDWTGKTVIDEDELHEIMEKFSTTPLDPARPQWEILMVPKYRMKHNLPDSYKSKEDNYALIFRLHHSYSDAISFLLMTNNHLADKPGKLPIDPTKPVPAPEWVKALIWTKIALLGPMYFVLNMGNFMFLDMTGYKVPYYSERKLYGRSSLLKMDALKELKKNSGASVTAILMSCSYAAMYRAHVKVFKGRKVPEYLINGNVGAMLPYTDDRLCNRFTLFPLIGPFKEMDPKERLEKMIEVNKEALLSPDPIFDFYAQRGLGSLPSFMHRILFGLSGTPLMLSNVPGYTTHLQVFGSKMIDVAAWLPLVSTTGIGIATQSYCGTMRLCCIVDSNVFSRKCDLQDMLDDIVHEIHILANIYQVSDVPTTTTVLLDVNNNTDMSCRNNSDNQSELQEVTLQTSGRHNDDDVEILRTNTAESKIEKEVINASDDIRRRILLGKSIQ